MKTVPFPFLAEVAKIQEQILLPLFLKISRMQEELRLKIGVESDADLESGFRDVYKRCQEQTLTSFRAMYALYEAALYIAKSGIPGDFVECGVWRGGSAMIVALALLRVPGEPRKLYLYDTYEGMPETGVHDQDVGIGPFQIAMNISTMLRGGHIGVFYAPLADVRSNMKSTGYPEDQVVFVKGLIEQTIPYYTPEKISLLHLDSDLYESTYHELRYLYPRLATGGVLIIDDYGNWKGSRKATDQYFAEEGITMLLTPIGSDGARMGIKG